MSGEPLTLREVQPRDWHALSAGFRDLTFEQTRAYCEPAAARVGATPRFIAVERSGEVVALAAMRVKKIPLLGRGIVWLPAGPMVLAPGKPDPVVLPELLTPGTVLDAFASVSRSEN